MSAQFSTSFLKYLHFAFILNIMSDSAANIHLQLNCISNIGFCCVSVKSTHCQAISSGQHIQSFVYHISVINLSILFLVNPYWLCQSPLKTPPPARLCDCCPYLDSMEFGEKPGFCRGACCLRGTGVTRQRGSHVSVSFCDLDIYSS